MIVLVCGGCTGNIDGSPNSASPSNAMGTPTIEGDDAPREGSFRGELPDAAACSNTPPSIGSAPLGRLTRRQYAFTVRDVLGVDPGLGASFPADQKVYGYDTARYTGEDVQTALQYAETAQRVAERAVDVLGPPCAGSDCAAAFFSALSSKLFRRAPEPEQVARYEALYTVGTTELDRDPRGAAALVLEGMLRAPSFLYRVEPSLRTGDGSVVPLSGRELAVRLSYLLFQSAPDDALFAAADEGRLETAEQIEAEARRMLADARSDRSLIDFHVQWLWGRTGPNEQVPEIVKDRERFPIFDEELLASAERAFHALVLRHAREGTLRDFFLDRRYFADARLAPLYGASLAEDGEELVEIEAADPARSGVLTDAYFLLAHTKQSAIGTTHLGHLVRDRFFCQQLAPPADVPDLVLVEGEDEAVAFDRHRDDPACVGCHQKIDPIGEVFRQFDPMGRVTETPESERTGSLVETDVDDDSLTSVRELAERLAASEQVSQCYVQHWFAFATGRPPVDADLCALSRVHGRFVESGYDVEELVVALAGSDAMRFGVPSTAAPSCR